MQQKVSPIMLGRIVYWSILAMSVLVIYRLPPSQVKHTDNLFYHLLLIVAFADLLAMVYMDRMIMKAHVNPQQGTFTPNPQAAPIILASCGGATAIYGIVYHFLGGSLMRSLSFVLISILGYILFSILVVKYDSLPRDDSGQ